MFVSTPRGAEGAELGRRLHLSSFGLDVTAVGVAQPGLDYPLGTAYWAPHATTGLGVVDLVARLSPGAMPSAAGAEVLATRQRQHPEMRLSGAEVHGLVEAIVGRVRPVLLVLTATVAPLPAHRPPNQRLLPPGPAASTFGLVAAAGAADPRRRSAIR